MKTGQKAMKKMMMMRPILKVLVMTVSLGKMLSHNDKEYSEESQGEADKGDDNPNYVNMVRNPKYCHVGDMFRVRHFDLVPYTSVLVSL